MCLIHTCSSYVQNCFLMSHLHSARCEGLWSSAALSPFAAARFASPPLWSARRCRSTSSSASLNSYKVVRPSSSGQKARTPDWASSYAHKWFFMMTRDTQTDLSIHITLTRICHENLFHKMYEVTGLPFQFFLLGRLGSGVWPIVCWHHNRRNHPCHRRRSLDNVFFINICKYSESSESVGVWVCEACSEYMLTFGHAGIEGSWTSLIFRPGGFVIYIYI